MSDRREYELSDEQFQRLADAIKQARETPLIALNAGMPSSPQEVANRIWGEIAQEMHFEVITVLPVEGKAERFFTAVPTKQFWET